MKNRLILILAIAFALVAPTLAGMDGWGQNSEYQRHFNPNTIITLEGKISNIHRDIRPMPNMDPGFSISLMTENEELIEVQVGPSWFTDFYKQKWEAKIGDKVKVTGSKVKIDGVSVIIATQGQKDDLVMVIRNNKGKPVWDLGVTDF